MLYCADVGEDAAEEIDVFTKGSNGGWPLHEGEYYVHGVPEVDGYTPPIISYAHGTGTTNGSCVIGGVVYRGSRFPLLNGAYVFGDWMNGRVWASFYDGSNAPTMYFLTNTVQMTCFGTDPRNGDILFSDSSNIRTFLPYVPELKSITNAGPNVVVSGADARPFQSLIFYYSRGLSSNWFFFQFGQADSNGNFTFTNSIDLSSPQKFYRIKR